MSGAGRGRSRAAALFALTVCSLCALGAPAARAEAVKLPKTRAVLDVPAGWAALEDAEARGLVAAYRTERGAVLAVTRAQVPNVDAYHTPARDAYAEQIERGIAASIPGYRRVSRRFGMQHGTPVLDVEAQRGDGAAIVVRVVLFWTYALSLAIEVPRGGDAAAARAIAARFGPPKP